MQANDSRRFHPYSQNRANTSSKASSSRPIQQQQASPHNPLINNENYEHSNYLNSTKISQKVIYPTLVKSNQERRSILKDKTNISGNQATSSTSESDKNDCKNLKIWSVTTKSMQVFSNRFEVLEKYSTNKKLGENSLPGSYLFEIIGQLDSTISTDESNGAREFSLKDSQGRIHCVFYEIDRQMDRFVRDSWIRCVGKFNFKNRLFHCLSVRLVKNQNELFGFGFQVNQTTAHIKLKFFKT